MTLLEIDEVRGGYAEVDILNGISLSLQKGEILTVAGTNGAGKSTLAKAIVGLLPRVQGRIVFEGADLAPLPTEARIARGIGYVPQVANVFGSLSILENLQVVVGVKDQGKRIAELFEVFPLLRERKRTREGSLSGGERQQLAFATRRRRLLHAASCAGEGRGRLRADPPAAKPRGFGARGRAAGPPVACDFRPRLHLGWRTGCPCRQGGEFAGR